MNEWLLIGKALFGFLFLALFLLGKVDEGTLLAVIMFILNADDIAEGVSLYKMKRELKKEEARA